MRQLYLFVFLSAIAMADDTNLEKALNTAGDQFTGNFFSEVVQAEPEKNVVVSAYSVMTLLALLSLASVGPSHDELLHAIGLPNDNVTKSVFSYADTKLRSLKGVELKAANKIYIPLNYELNPEFAAVSRDNFNCEVENIDFLKNVQAAKEINDWVENKTNNRIKDLVDPDSIDEDTRAILVNALYFKGAWITPFEKSLTRDRDFHITKDKTVKVPMMHNKADYLYAESDKLKSKILDMAYEGGQTSLTIILPNERDGIKDLLEKANDISSMQEEMKKMKKDEVDVFIPKFMIETTTDLKTTLQNMKVERLFTPGLAQLDNLLVESNDVYVSSATQKAFIKVDEEGTEAAAASQINVALTSVKINPREYNFNADHPFMFLLKEGNNILFAGLYYGKQ